MKKILLTLIFCGLTLTAKSQTASVEESTYGIQTGVLGIWAHNETKLSNQIALRVEIGMDAGFRGGSFYLKNRYLMTPVIRLEPRWYYNLNKRVSKSRNIIGNSGNFLTLQTSYYPNWFVISNYDNIEVADQVSIIPTWGIRRNIGNHFTYETGIGIGYRYIFAKSVEYLANEGEVGMAIPSSSVNSSSQSPTYFAGRNEGEVALNLHLRIGYRF